jgi:FKBP-type peptidyl-prolyl cis-trans isomerase FkpA
VPFSTHIKQSLNNFSLSEPEFEIVKSGITDGFLKRPPKMDLQLFGLKISQLQEARALVIAETEKKSGAGRTGHDESE